MGLLPCPFYSTRWRRETWLIDIRRRDLLKSTLGALDVEEELGDLASAEKAWDGIEQDREEHVKKLQQEVQGECSELPSLGTRAEKQGSQG